MRILNTYSFTVGNVPFADLFGLVDTFLQENGLQYDKLCYYIQDVSMDKEIRTFMAKDYRVIPNRKKETVSDMWDLVRDHPELSMPIILGDEHKGEYRLSNMDDFGNPLEDGCPEESIRLLTGQFPRPYYVSSVLFSYVNVNFFGSRFDPAVVRLSPKEKVCYPSIDIFRMLMFCSRAAMIRMTVDCTDSDRVLDAEGYAKSLSNILGKKYTAETVLQQSEAEKAEMETRVQAASPLVDAAQQAFISQLHRLGENVPPWERNLQGGNFKVAQSLKKIGKEYGFSQYHYEPIGIHYISKRTLGGHLLTLGMDTPRGFNELRLFVSIKGFGFSHTFGLEEIYGKNQEHADFIMRECFDIIKDLEETCILPICEHYPPTPQWYEINVF